MNNAQLIFLVICTLFAGIQVHGQALDNSAFDDFDSLIYQNVTRAKSILDSIEFQSGQKMDKGQVLKRKAIIARIEARYDDALDYNLAAMDIFEGTNDTIELATIYHNLGFLMRYLKDYDKAIDYFDAAIALRTQLRDSTELATSHREIGVIYRRKKAYEQAKYHYDKASTIYDPVRDRNDLLTLQGNYASLYHVQEKYEMAIQINKKALSLIKETRNANSLCTRYANIASAYSKLKYFDAAYMYIDSAIMVAQEAQLLEPQVRHLLLKAKIARRNRDYKTAYLNMRKHKTLNDSLITSTTKNTIEEQLLNFNLEKQHIQDTIKTRLLTENIKYEKAEKEKSLWLALALVSLLIAGLVWQVMRVKMIKLRAKNEELSAKLLKDKLRLTNQENERLVNQSQLQLEFKKSIIEKIDTISAVNNRPETKIRDLKRLLMDQLRIENQSNVLNESIQKMPSAYDEILRQNYPALTKGERKMCFLVKNGLSIKEIATINETSTTAVQSMRYRIRKKMKIQKGEELQFFLENL